jgi:uncharacterized iron-regulated membrane protein
MSTLVFILLAFAWTLLSFFTGVIVHWWSTRKQRRLLKMYRIRESERRRWNRPIE